MKKVKLTSLYDYTSMDPKLAHGDGFACLIETDDMTILVDTPFQDRLMDDKKNDLLRNMDLLEIDPMTIDVVFITHKHASAGLVAFLEINPKVVVYTLEDEATELIIEDLGAMNVKVSSFREIGEGIYSSGPIEGRDYDSDILEQVLIITSEEGIIIVTGCSHPSPEAIVGAVREQFETDPIYMLYGGLHLKQTMDTDLYGDILHMLSINGVERLAANHCSGEAFIDFARESGYVEFIETGVGYELLIE